MIWETRVFFLRYCVVEYSGLVRHVRGKIQLQVRSRRSMSVSVCGQEYQKLLKKVFFNY